MITVALCTRNGAAFVDEQVRSILSQVPEPDELVLGDDASRDDTVAIVERAVADHRASGGRTALVVRRHDPPLGVVGNFEDALQHAKGDLIALSDQDDIWRPGKLEAVVAA
ncbi:MAG: glycosyltransferase, partial [Leifsonia sp.]